MGKLHYTKSLILVLLLLICGNRHTDHYSPPLALSSNNATSLNAAHNTADIPAFIKNHSLRKDWIKIRYMGGECKYDPFVIPIITTPAEFIENTKRAEYASVVSSFHPFLFKLRGPPCPFAFS